MKIQAILAILLLTGGMGVAAAQAAPSNGNTLTYTQPLSMSAVRSVQEKLDKLGLYKGKVDGDWGTDSTAALEQFQQMRGLQVTGQLNEATVKTLDLEPAALLGFQNPSQAESAKTGKAGSSRGMTLSPESIRRVQRRLRQLNFEVGRVDGIWGAQTQKALMQFQQGHALQPTGQLNPATINALGLDANHLLFKTGQQ